MSSSDDDFYRRRIRAVLTHIGAHLDEDLSLERLAEVAGMSRFHFHRQFSAITGVPVARLIALLRLKQASLELFLEDPRVIDVALRAGFQSPEAFARAFRRAQGQSPSQFKRAPDWERWAQAFRHPFHLQGAPMDVQIVEFPATPVAVLEHQGPPDTLMRSVASFIEWRKGSDVSPNGTSATYGVPWSDPDQGDPAEWRFDICGSTEVEAVPSNPQGVIRKQLPGGRCAVARHEGSTDRIGETVYALYRDWLPGSGERVRDFPCFFHYVQRMPSVSELEQITDVYLPLEG